MSKLSGLQIGNIIFFIITLVINFLSQSAFALDINLFAFTVRDLAESRAIFFLPAGYVFGIWGVIYTGLIAFIIYTSRPSQKDNPIHQKIGYWFIISCIANFTWLILFLNDLVVLSTVAMLVLFVALFIIYTRLEIGKSVVKPVVKWAVHVPFSIYIGWISVATVANITVSLYVEGQVLSFLGINADIWAVVMMAIAGVLAFGMLYFRKDVAYACVVVWAVVGIYARPFDTEVFQELASLNSGLVDTGALAIAGLVAVATLGRFVMTRMNAGNNGQQGTLAPAGAD